MKQYKTIAGPIELKAQTGEDYENAVRQYAKIIDEEAVGGWALHLIQQIAVKKLAFATVIIGATIGAILGAIIGSEMTGEMSGVGGLLIGLMVGGGLGCLGLKYNYVFFNMLVFVQDDAVSFKSGVPGSSAGQVFRQGIPANASIAEQAESASEQADPLVRRAFMLLEDREWDKADEFFEQALSQEPESAKAYVGKLCVELRINREDDLYSHSAKLADNSNYIRAIRFADEEYRRTLEHYALTPEERQKIEEDKAKAEFERVAFEKATLEKATLEKAAREEYERNYQRVLSKKDALKAKLLKNANDTNAQAEYRAMLSDLEKLGNHGDAPKTLKELSEFFDYCMRQI